MSEFGDGQAICLPLPRKFTYNEGEVSIEQAGTSHHISRQIIQICHRVTSFPQNKIQSPVNVVTTVC